MAFTPLSGVRGYVGTPQTRRPYTRGPTRPPDVPHINVGTAVRSGTTAIERPRPPDVADRAALVQVTPAAPAAPTALTAAAATVAGAQADGLEAYLAGITNSAERAYVAAQIAPKIASLRAQQQALTQQVAAEQAAVQGLAQAMLGGQLRGLAGNVAGPYEQIAGIQTGSGSAEAAAMAGVGKDVSAENAAILGAIGAPGAQAAALANQNQDIFTGGGLVLQGTGGTIPAFQTQGTGIGAQAWAAAQPTLAADYAQETTRQLLAQAAKDQAALGTKYTDIATDVTTAREDWATKQEETKKAAEERATSLYNAGMYTQRQYAQALGLANWQSYPATVKSSGSAHLIRYTDPATKRTLIYNPDTGRSITLPGQGVAPAKAGSTHIIRYTDPATGQTRIYNPDTGEAITLPGQGVRPAKAQRLTFQTVKGHRVGIDPVTGDVVVDYGAAGVNRPRAPLHLTFQTVNGRRVAINPVTGRQVFDYGPVRGPRAGGGVRPPSAAALRRGWTTITEAHDYGGLTRSEVMQALRRVNSARAKQKLPLLRLDMVPKMTREDRRELLGIGPPLDPQEVYMKLVHSGIRPRRAWTMVRRYYPNFGPDYFPGKAESAAETAVDVSKWVTVAPGADRPGMATHPGILQFAAQVAQVHGSPLTVTTGTHHNQYVKDSPNQSAHWTGWATDIAYGHGTGSDNVDPALTKLGQDALIAAGMPEAQARKVTHWEGGDYNGYNILFNTYVGGNHYNHLHIGLRPSRQRDPKPVPSESSGGYPTSSAPWDPQKARTAAGARKVAQAMALNRGWSGAEWAALNALWTRESGFNYSIHNKQGSGAVGIPQAMPSAHELPADFLTNPVTQIQWGLDYIRSTYGTPSRAWAFWRATVNHDEGLAPPDLRAHARDWISKGYAGY